MLREEIKTGAHSFKKKETQRSIPERQVEQEKTIEQKRRSN